MRKLRNIAIIAHVDHGKTTLVDKMILQGNLFRSGTQTGELMLDNNDLERERGITILSKNVSVIYKDYKINIIDTPGHADFGGEVERVLNMADGVLLLVDAFEGTMPQTRFVLQKALALGKRPIVVINKVDKPNCRPEFVNEQVFDLMFTLEASEDQLDYRTVYGSAKHGWMSHILGEKTENITPLLDAIIDDIPELKRELITLSESKTHTAMSRYALLLAERILEISGMERSDAIEECLTVNIRWQNKEAHFQEGRDAAGIVNALARDEKDPVKAKVLRALGQVAATPHVRWHSLAASEYAIVVINLMFPHDFEKVMEERKIQIKMMKSV